MPTHVASLFVLVLTAATWLVPGVAAAQRVRGLVIDPATGPVAEASLHFRLPGQTDTLAVRSDSLGAFSAALPSPGTWELTVARVGYDQVGPTPISVATGQAVEITVRLGARALALPAVEVRAARQTLTGLEQVYQRIERMRQLGVGRALTRDQIERLNPQNVGSVLRAMSSQLRVVESPQMIVNTVFMRGGARGGGSCPAAVFIDGFRVNQRPTNINMLIEPRHIEAVELYIGGAQVPIGFHDPGGCGSVLIWSRRGSPAEGAPHNWKRYAIAGALVLGAVLLFR